MNEGDMWEMEVDLRSREKEKRTLHFFVRCLIELNLEFVISFPFYSSHISILFLFTHI